MFCWRGQKCYLPDMGGCVDLSGNGSSHSAYNTRVAIFFLLRRRVPRPCWHFFSCVRVFSFRTAGLEECRRRSSGPAPARRVRNRARISVRERKRDRRRNNGRTRAVSTARTRRAPPGIRIGTLGYMHEASWLLDAARRLGCVLGGWILRTRPMVERRGRSDIEPPPLANPLTGTTTPYRRDLPAVLLVRASAGREAEQAEVGGPPCDAEPPRKR